MSSLVLNERVLFDFREVHEGEQFFFTLLARACAGQQPEDGAICRRWVHVIQVQADRCNSVTSAGRGKAREISPATQQHEPRYTVSRDVQHIETRGARTNNNTTS